MNWFAHAADHQQALSSSAHAPLFAAFEHSINTLPQLPSSVLALCRLRIAQLHGNGMVQAQAASLVAEAQRQALDEWPTTSLLSDGEKACLAFAEVYTMDAAALTDEHADAVKAHYGDAGLVALVQALGLYYGLTRMTQLWNVPGARPEAGA